MGHQEIAEASNANILVGIPRPRNGMTRRTGLAETELNTAALYQIVENRRVPCSNRGSPGSEDSIVALDEGGGFRLMLQSIMGEK